MAAMTNLLAILLSVAMMLTGAPGTEPPDGPVGRVMTLGNLVAKHNDAEVELLPFASLGAMTDGSEAVYDFYVGMGDERLMSFQLAADADGLLLLNDSSGVKLKLTAGDLEALLKSSGFLPEDGEDEQGLVLTLTGEFLPAYVDLLRLMRDEDQMKALEAAAWQLYDETVARGEGLLGVAEYQGELYEVQTYEYTLTGPQIGALADRICAANEALNRYVTAYFKLISQMPDDMGLNAARNYEELYSQIDISMRVSESIANNGLNLMDCVFTMNVPGSEKPLRFNTHQARLGDDRFSTLSATVETEEMSCEQYLEYSLDDRDIHILATLTGNALKPAAEDGAEGDGEGDAEEDFEGDAPDMLYATFDYDLSHGEGGSSDETMSFSMDVAAIEGHFEFSTDGQRTDDGMAFSHISGFGSTGNDTYELDLDVVVTDELFERRITEADAQSLGDFDPAALLAGLGADAVKLTGEASVKQLIEMFTPAAPEADDVAADKPEADFSALPFGRPVFDWLPEGYAVDSVEVDAQYGDVSCVLANPKTGDEIDVEITSSYEREAVAHYVVQGDNFMPIEGMLVTEERSGDANAYFADDGSVSISIYPSSAETPATDVLNLLIGLHFEEGAEG